MGKTTTGWGWGESPLEATRWLLAGAGLTGGTGLTIFLLMRALENEPMFVIVAIVFGVYFTCGAVFGALLLGTHHRHADKTEMSVMSVRDHLPRRTSMSDTEGETQPQSWMS